MNNPELIINSSMFSTFSGDRMSSPISDKIIADHASKTNKYFFDFVRGCFLNVRTKNKIPAIPPSTVTIPIKSSGMFTIFSLHPRFYSEAEHYGKK